MRPAVGLLLFYKEKSEENENMKNYKIAVAGTGYVLKKKTLPISSLAKLMFLAMMVADLFSSLDLPLVGNADELMGVIAWIVVLFYLFRNIRSVKKSVMYIYKIVQRVLSFHSASIRNGTLLLYGCLLIASIAFGTAGSWGCTVYMLLPMLIEMDKDALPQYLI